MLASLTEIQAERARRDLSVFIKGAWNVVEPHTPYLHNWHIDLISEYLIAVTLGEITRLIINVAPRHMKSRQITTIWPCWEWIDNPQLRYLFSSYGLNLARDHSRERRQIIESEWYQDRWGKNYQLRDDQNVITSFSNTEGGKQVSRGTGGASTGMGGNRIIIDDPHNVKQSESAVQRETSIRDFDQNLSTRLDNPKNDAIILVMQRLHYNDMTAHLLEVGGFEHLVIPSIASKKLIVTYPRSKMVIERPKDDILWPERMGKKELDQAKRALGNTGFEAQHQQTPIMIGGNRIKLSWFKRYRVVPAVPKRCVQSWDTGLKPKNTASPSVCLTFIQDQHDQWALVNVYRKQVGYPELKKAVLVLYNLYTPQAVLIEDKASGIQLLQEYKGIIPTIPIEPESDKITRMETQSPLVEAGMVSLPVDAPWLDEFENEIMRFPEPETWDQIDTLSQFLKYIFTKQKEIKMVQLDGY